MRWPKKKKIQKDTWLYDQKLSFLIILCLHVSACLSVSLPVCLTICLSVCLPLCLSVCLSLFLSPSLQIDVSVSLRHCLSLYLSTCVHRWLCLSVCLSVSLSLSYIYFAHSRLWRAKKLAWACASWKKNQNILSITDTTIVYFRSSISDCSFTC